MEKGWKEVFATSLEYQAIMARDILEASEIKAVLLNQKDSSYQMFGQFAIYVPEEFEEPARELLKELAN